MRVAYCLLSLILVMGWCACAQACPVPVFRYALENWDPMPYEVIVYHRGPLTTDEKNVYAALHAFGADNNGIANFAIRDVDLAAADAGDDDRKLWEAQGATALPRIIMLLPATVADHVVAWSAALTPDSAHRLMDSPARREIARRMIAGDSAVWVLVAGAKKEETEAAATTLEKQLAQDQTTITLPDGATDAVAPGGPPLKIAFSVVRIARGDPAEEVFLKILGSLDPQHSAGDHPMAVPLFGRGRAPTAFAGDNITADSVRDCDEFMCGPCACQIKEQNPGIDFLVAADWNDALSTGKLKDLAVPSLTGLAQFAAATPAGSTPHHHMVFIGVAAVILVFVAVSTLLWSRMRKTKV